MSVLTAHAQKLVQLRRRIPVRFLLLVVAALLVLPGFLFGAVLIDRFSARERADNLAELRIVAVHAAEALDREMGGLLIAARVLASSNGALACDPVLFAPEARIVGGVVGQPIALVPIDGEVALFASAGAPARLGEETSAQIARAATLGKPSISDLLRNADGAFRLAVLAPVPRGAGPGCAVVLWITPEFVSSILQDRGFDADTVGNVRDRGNRLIARSRDLGRYLGNVPMAPARPNPAEAVPAVSLDGRPLLAVSAPMHSAEWRVNVGTRAALIDSPMRGSALWLALTGIAMALLGGVVAWRLAGQISVPLGRLAAAGRALGAGEEVTPVESRIAEIGDVSAALLLAGLDLRERDASLAAERARLAAIIETVPVGLRIAAAGSGAVVTGNRQLARLLPSGVMEAFDEADAVVPASDLPLERALGGEDPAEARCRIRRADGSLIWVQAVAAPIRSEDGEITGGVLALLDIDEVVRARQQNARWAERLEVEVRARIAQLEQTNKKLRDEITARFRAEDRARQSQKMEAVGRLTGGIAHDFNNLLTIIMGSLDLLRRRAADPRALRLIESATEGTTRAAELVARLLAFSRRQPLLPQTLDVNQLVLGMSSLFRRTLGEAISVETTLAPALWRAMADPNQLESALLNLAVNARDAIVDTAAGGGQLRIETSNVTVPEPVDGVGPTLQPGDYVVIATRDNGAGMSAETLAQVFEPFFTTKGQGRGTGLGLSQVHGFAVQSGGQVYIQSTLGSGTEVRLLLPCALGDEAAAAQLASEGAEPAALAGLTVLLVEDDPGVRQFTADSLRLLGYEVVEAEHAAPALAVIDGSRHIDLLLTDVVMPGMSGRDLAQEAQRRRPGLPVLLASGYSADTGEPDLRWELLAKPFSVAALAAKVAEILCRHRDGVAHGDPPARDDLGEYAEVRVAES